ELLRPERGSWLDYASCLAPHSEDHMESVVDVMSRAARGQAPRMRQLGIETDHPLSSIFVDEGSISAVQARALAAMVRVYRRAAAPLRERIEAEWAYATHNADAGVRATVARAVAATHADLRSGLPSGGAATEAVALLAADPNADVRSTAYQALGAAAAASDGTARAELLAVLRRAAESETAAVALLAINSAYEVASGASAGAAGLD
ncbi:MAG TPA: hypothetical protein VE913_15995, partial [Longimicrobium sp.]|nr:hypothetical protein [Longimicrobium sp.]